VYALAFDEQVKWGQHELQDTLGYLLLQVHGRDAELVSYWGMAGLIVVMLTCAAISGREMLAKGAVSSMWALRGE
jgi:hypothetical protein